MSFRHLPTRYARRLRGMLAILYAFVAYAGISALIWTPRTIEGQIGDLLVYLWAALAIAGGLAGLWGAARDRWQVERWAAPLAGGGLAAYAVTVWSLAITNTGRLSQASVVTVATLGLLYRAGEVAATAARDRAEHDEITRA